MKNLLLLILFFGGIGTAFAQSSKLTDEKRKEFEAQKIAFFTQELDLSPEEAAVFWPLYNEMQRKYRDIEEIIRAEYKRVREAKTMKEADYAASVNYILVYEQKMRDIKKEYYGKLMAVVPASKIWKLDGAERKFHRQLFDKLRRECTPKK